MANGEQTGVEEIWEGITPKDEVEMATKSTLIMIAKRLEHLPCKNHKEEIKKNSDLRKKLIFGFSVLSIIVVAFKWIIERFV